MWVARLKVWHANSYVVEKTRGLDGGLVSYYLNNFEKDGKTYISRAAVVFGKDADKLFQAILDDPRLLKGEMEGRQIFFSNEARTNFHTLLLDKTLFLVKPVIAKDGFEYWTVAAHDKRGLTGLVKRIRALKPKAGCEVLSLKKERVSLFPQGAAAKLTEKQRNAFEQACRHGYYKFPRRITLEKLAKKLGVPETTFRAHLRKAEAKLYPALSESFAF